MKTNIIELNWIELSDLPGALKNNATTCANTGACLGVAGHKINWPPWRIKEQCS